MFEKDENPTVRPRDWNFGVYWARSRIQECLTPELYAQPHSVFTDPAQRPREDSIFPIYHGMTGELLKELPAPYSIRLRRRAWLELMKTGLDIRVYGGTAIKPLTFSGPPSANHICSMAKS